MKKDRTPAFQPALISNPWQYIGISRSAFYRLLAKGQVPPPVAVPGSERRWRRADLDEWIDQLKPFEREE